MTVKIHGKDYREVVDRVNDFRTGEEYKGFGIETEILGNTLDYCMIKATIRDTEGRIRATGIAQELQSDGHINKTSYVENCETSAIGRALASMGLGGTSYASANEVSDAIIKQKVQESIDRLVNHNKLVNQYIHTIAAIKSGIASESLSEAAEEWFGLDKEVMTGLWISPSAGGIFSTKEREVMKTSEFRKSHFGEGE